MKPKAHILIVEDKAILYKRLSMALKQENYAVDGFTPSVEKALERIQSKTPDIALLDIDLEGEQTGIDLGKILSEDYKIPFIYVTDYDDNETFFKSLKTDHESFLIKTKPHLDTEQVLRAIQTALHRNKKELSLPRRDALLCFPEYIGKSNYYAANQVSQVPIRLDDIILITNNSLKMALDFTGKSYHQKLKPNYTRVETFKKQSYYLPFGLEEIIGKLPSTFIRINESQIVNLSHHAFEGRMNDNRLKIGDYICNISKTYMQEVEKRFELLYN